MAADPEVATRADPALSDRDFRSFSFLLAALVALVLGALLLQQDAASRRTSQVLRLAPAERFSPNELANAITAEVPAIATPEPAPTPEAPPPPSEASIARVRIGAIKLDASVITLGIDAAGVMQAPSKPLDIGWYDFTARPGFGGNAVFGGHVDYHDFGAAIFWNLRLLQEGDEIQVGLADDTVYSYRVISNRTYGANSAPVDEIIGPTEHESITLITCDGTFNTRTREYDSRRVVRAERLN